MFTLTSSRRVRDRRTENEFATERNIKLVLCDRDEREEGVGGDACAAINESIAKE